MDNFLCPPSIFFKMTSNHYPFLPISFLFIICFIIFFLFICMFFNVQSFHLSCSPSLYISRPPALCLAPDSLLGPRSWPYPLVPAPALALALALNLYLPALAQICNLCDLSLGSLEDISPAQIYRADLNSVVFFLLSFVAIYSLNETYFSILVFSDPILFSLFLFLCSTFPVFYFLSFSSVFLCISSTFSFCLSCLSFTFLLCLLSFSSSSNFLCLPSNFSFCFYLFLCLLLSFLAFFYFHSLPVFYYIPLTLLFMFLHICVFLLLSFLFSVLLFCIFYLSIFCLPLPLIFLLFPFSFIFLILFIFLLSLIILC